MAAGIADDTLVIRGRRRSCANGDIARCEGAGAVGNNTVHGGVYGIHAKAAAGIVQLRLRACLLYTSRCV